MWGRSYQVLDMHAKLDPLARRELFSGYSHITFWKFDPLPSFSKNKLWSIFYFRCNHWYERGATFICRIFWKWIKRHFNTENRKRLTSGSKLIWHAYLTRNKVSFTYFIGSKFISLGIWLEIVIVSSQKRNNTNGKWKFLIILAIFQTWFWFSNFVVMDSTS